MKGKPALPGREGRWRRGCWDDTLIRTVLLLQQHYINSFLSQGQKIPRRSIPSSYGTRFHGTCRMLYVVLNIIRPLCQVPEPRSVGVCVPGMFDFLPWNSPAHCRVGLWDYVAMRMSP